jgi:hypothetical protein
MTIKLNDYHALLGLRRLVLIVYNRSFSIRVMGVLPGLGTDAI